MPGAGCSSSSQRLGAQVFTTELGGSSVRNPAASAFGETAQTAASVRELRDDLVDPAGCLGAAELLEQGIAGFSATFHDDLDPAVCQVARAADQAEFQSS